MKRLLLTMGLMLTAVCSWASGFVTVGGLKYLVDTSKKEATLLANDYSGDIVVPEKVTYQGMEYPVVAFDSECFNYCTSLTSITIPSSVTSLGGSCFNGCTGLTSITIPSSVTSLGDLCFASCTSLDSIAIPSSVTSLGEGCFYGCDCLKAITIPSSVTSLGDGCFEGCTSLDSIAIPSSVTSLGYDCFSSCSSLTSITIPSSVTSLGNYCFSWCTSLTSITIPSSVTSLGNECFSSCSSLTSITIPSSVTSIGGGCFNGCGKLEMIECYAVKPLSIGNGVFYNVPISSSVLLVPQESIETYKTKYPWSGFGYILALDGTEPEEKTCEAPTITYSNGELQFTSATAGAEYHYTISDADMVSNAYSQNGKVQIVATYDISAYATADGYNPSETSTAKLFFIKSDAQIDNINQAQMRGIVASSNGGVVTLSGLNNNEQVSFYSVDGKMIGTVNAINGEASLAAKAGEIVIAKFGESNIKIVVK